MKLLKLAGWPNGSLLNHSLRNTTSTRPVVTGESRLRPRS